MLIFLQESKGKKKMQFQIHKSGLHYVDTRDKYFTIVNTVSKNKEGFTARNIKGEKAAKDLYAMLIYPSVKDYKWVVHSNQIKNCPLMLQDVNVAQNFWGKDIPSLKGKTNQRKPNGVARYQVKISVELMKLHKEVFLTYDIIFCEQDLSNCTSQKIFKAFK